MIIEDVNGNEITNPDLTKGRLEKAIKSVDGEGIETYVYVYFPFTEEEQEYFDLVNRHQRDTEAALCEIYELITEG